MQKFYLTPEGKAELEKKLEYYKNVKRKEASEHIKEARGYCDLSENAEYDAAKEEQALIEQEIVLMQWQLENAELIETDAASDQVVVGATVRFYDCDMKEEDTVTIVGQAEASISAGRISNESPLARALLGAKVGDKRTVEMPDDTYDIEVLEITVG